jgi:GAF domain-containing protein
MQAVADLFEALAQIQELSKLLHTATNLISGRFGFYHVGVYFVDNNKEFAILQAANSEGGQKLLDRKQRLRVESEGLVGFVTGCGQARVALDVTKDSNYFDNPDLPDTRMQIVLPLKIGGETIGALDLQSTKPDVFFQENIEVLSTLANQLTIAIQNARNFELTRQAVLDAETAYRQLTGETWNQLMRTKESFGYSFDGIKARSLSEKTASENGNALTIPVRLRGQEIGSLKLTSLKSGRTWSEDEITMAESAAERAALSLENARLLEAAHWRAAKERTISEGTTRMNAAMDIESILEATAKELERALNSSEIVIQLE